MRSEALRLEWIDPARFHAAPDWFRKHTDKAWSFTDCASFAVMRELRVRDAFTTDRHFRQAGSSRCSNRSEMEFGFANSGLK
jgi:predicted nucleic acid-binding protein